MENIDLYSKTYLIAQLFGLLAMLVSITSQQFKSRKKLLILFIISNLLNSAHFLLLSAMSGFVLAIIGAVRFGVSIFSTKKYWLILFLIINTIAVPFIFEGFLLSGIAYLAATSIIISTFLKSDNLMRICIIIGALGWLIYGILIGSVIAIISNAFFLISSIIGWYRYIYKKQNPAKL
jgi:hypothetical protein